MKSMIVSDIEKPFTKEDVDRLFKMEKIEDCKQYLKLMVDFYFDAINLLSLDSSEKSDLDKDKDLWLQMMFSKGCQFMSLLDGFSYSRGANQLMPVIDFTILFTLTRHIYEWLVSFEILYCLPKTENQKKIINNLFKAQGLKERLESFEKDSNTRYLERLEEERNSINACKKEIENTLLYKRLPQESKQIIDNAFGKKFRYYFDEEGTLKSIKYGGGNKEYKILGITNDSLMNGMYSFFSLHSHPSHISLIQFRDAYKETNRGDKSMAKFATRCTVSFMSIFITDFMTVTPLVKTLLNDLDEYQSAAIILPQRVLRSN